MICPNCGKTIRENSEYCIFCGLSQNTSVRELGGLAGLIRISFCAAVISLAGGLMPISVYGKPLLIVELLVSFAALMLCAVSGKKAASLFKSKKAEYRGKTMLRSARMISVITFAASLFTFFSKMYG